jgi:hypothetical protein
VDALIWILATLVVVGSLLGLVKVARSLWRHTRKLAGTVGEAADRVATATADLQLLSDEMAARQESRR